MKRVTLEDGRQVWALNASDATVLHHQIFALNSYAGHGIQLRDGACVFDVGANIGLFSLWLSARHPRLDLHLFEPIPAVFAALEKNCPGASLYPVGLSDRVGEAEFTWDPLMSSTATMHPGHERAAIDRAGPGAWAAAMAADLAKTGPHVPGPIARLAVAALEVGRRLSSKKVRCPLRTVSDVIAEKKLTQIDLLKVDAEGAEAAVLAGVAEADWPKVQQVIVETNDADAIAKTLRARGFAVEVDQGDWATFKLLGLHDVFARRP